MKQGPSVVPQRDQASKANTEETVTNDEIATAAIGDEADNAPLVLLLAVFSFAVCEIVDGSEPSDRTPNVSRRTRPIA